MIDEIAKLLTRAESEAPSDDLLTALKSASVGVEAEIVKESKKKDQFWTAATDIRTDAKTREAAKKGHADLEFLIATLESASGQLEKAFKSVQAAIVTVARDEGRAALEPKRKAIVDRIVAEWDAHVDALEEMLNLLKEVEKATTIHNQRHQDKVPPADTLVRPRVFKRGLISQDSTPLFRSDIQRVDPARPIHGRDL